jgi:hypothetical protein
MSEILNISSDSNLKTGLNVPKIRFKFKHVSSHVIKNDSRRRE